MPSVTDKPNGKCVIRVFCATDEFGKKDCEVKNLHSEFTQPSLFEVS